MPIPLPTAGTAAAATPGAASAAGGAAGQPPPPGQQAAAHQHGQLAPAVLTEVPYEERHLGYGSGGEELEPEEDFFYDTQEYDDMETQWRQFYFLNDEVDTSSLDTVATDLRELADRLERLGREGWRIDHESICDEDLVLVNPAIEREQWRQRRQRRRAALAAARQEEEREQEREQDPSDGPGPGPNSDVGAAETGMEVDGGDGQEETGRDQRQGEQQQPAAAAAEVPISHDAAVAAVARLAALLKSPPPPPALPPAQMASPTFALF